MVGNATFRALLSMYVMNRLMLQIASTAYRRGSAVAWATLAAWALRALRVMRVLRAASGASPGGIRPSVADQRRLAGTMASRSCSVGVPAAYHQEVGWARRAPWRSMQRSS